VLRRYNGHTPLEEKYLMKCCGQRVTEHKTDMDIQGICGHNKVDET
jgi:hypothetical protein